MVHREVLQLFIGHYKNAIFSLTDWHLLGKKLLNCFSSSFNTRCLNTKLIESMENEMAWK